MQPVNSSSYTPSGYYFQYFFFRQRYEEVIDQLKKEHEEAKFVVCWFCCHHVAVIRIFRESLVAAVSDRDNLEEELDRLSVRHDKLIQDSIAKENQWREK